MKVHIRKSFRTYLEDALCRARLRRNDGGQKSDAVLAKLLVTAEAAGDAMRYLDGKGQIAWRATPELRAYLEDLRADAEADTEAEVM